MKFLKKLSFERGLQILVGLNLIDAVSTDFMLRTQTGIELNPLLAWAYMVHPALFWGLKVGMVAIALMLLALAPAVAPLLEKDPAKAEEKVQATILFAILLYAVIFLTHLLGWIGLL